MHPFAGALYGLPDITDHAVVYRGGVYYAGDLRVT